MALTPDMMHVCDKSWALGAMVVMVASAAVGCGRTPVPDPPFGCHLEDDLPEAGCEFVAGPGLYLSGDDRVDSAVGEPDALLVLNPHPQETLRIRVWESAPGNREPWARGPSIVLEPGHKRVVPLPRFEQPEQTARRTGGLVRVEGSRPFTVTAFRPYRVSFGNGSEWLLPIDAVGRDYVVASYEPHPAQFQGAGEPSYFEVIALTDDTELRWKPPVATAGDGETIAPAPAGQWSAVVTLDRDESLRVSGTRTSSLESYQGDVSGTVIEASAPVIAIGGSRCSTVPSSIEPLRGCDPIVEQLVPVDKWGRHVAVPHPPLRVSESHYVRIYAGADDVAVSTDPAVSFPQPTVLAQRGDYLDLVVPHGTSFTVDANGPVLAVGLLATREMPIQIGDSAMVQYVPTERFLSRYVVSTGGDWSADVLQAIRPVGGPAVEIDGVPLEGWKEFGDYEFATLEVATGTYTVTSEEPFGLVQFGWTNEARDTCAASTNFNVCHTAYAHAAGMRLR